MDAKTKLYETGMRFGLSDEKTELYADVFLSIDCNHDGVISAEELEKALSQLGFSVSSEETKKMVQQVDENNDGMVDFNEFIHMAEGMASIWTPTNAEDDVLMAFKVFDLNNDGIISIQELQQTLTKIGHPLSKEETMEILKAMDVNGDGVISYREFVNSWMEFLSVTDSSTPLQSTDNS